MADSGDGRRRADLPTGVVTFLFTDIEGSTKLVQRLGDRYTELLAAHDAIIRRAIADQGGIEVNTEGDAFFAVFTSAGAAVSSAVAAQRALGDAAWPADATVRVRMGVHTGAGLLGGDDYLGLDVHRAARVAGAANGGQVLVSEATRGLFGDATAHGERFRDLGAYRLKDLGPARLYQVVAPGLLPDALPPRASRVGRLPDPRTSFVGRADVLGTLRDLLGTTRLLVLTGTGGAGKTRLGIELARSAMDDFPDGVFFVPLDTVTDRRLIPSSILDVLGLSAGARPPADVLREALAPMHALLILDNVEQIPDIGVTIDELQDAPALKLVITSRAALHVYGEQEYRVPPLALPPEGPADLAVLAGSESVALFVDRARASRPDFLLTPDDAAAVADICRRLDGLPLAVELAAARIRLLPPHAILARLDGRLRSLERQAPNLPPRQRSIRAAIEWSYALLDEAEQRLLDRLSVFAGGFGFEAVEAVCDPDGDLGLDVLDGIGSLLDKSLIVDGDQGREPRFALLQTIREYARERLGASGDEDAMSRRHAEYFRAIVAAAEPEFVGTDPRTCAARLGLDQDNIRAALDWALTEDDAPTGLAIGASAWRLWQLRGQLPEGRRYLTALLDLPSASAPDAHRARALTALGGILYWQSDPDARASYEAALAIYESLGDETGIAESLSNLGYVALTGSPADPSRARDHFRDSLRRYASLGDERMIASLTGSIGYAEMALGRQDEARLALERALALNVAGGYRGRAADNRFALGNLHRGSRRLSESASMYRAALADAVDMQDSSRTLTFLTAIASWAAEAGRYAEAVRLGAAVNRAGAEQGGALGTLPGILDPVELAREHGLDERAIDAEAVVGRTLAVTDAVAYAFSLLGEPVEDPEDRVPPPS